MSETTDTTVTAEADLDSIKLKIADLEARVTHLEGQIDFHSTEHWSAVDDTQ